jgi:hypothetical protein
MRTPEELQCENSRLWKNLSPADVRVLRDSIRGLGDPIMEIYFDIFLGNMHFRSHKLAKLGRA